MTEARIAIPRDELVAFCRRHHIRSLSLFGSVVRDDFGPESDVDVLIEFEPDHHPGLGLIAIQDELSALLGGHPVDLVFPKYLNHRIRDQVLAEAEVVYVE